MATPASDVSYRIATDADLPLLVSYREECGWGKDALLAAWTDPDRVYCVLTANIDGETTDVGMGCWYLHQPDDLELACRDTGVIHLASLFIRHEFQGRKFGTAAMDLLERGAVVDFGAKIVTLDTVAYLVVMDETNTYCVEDPTKPGRSQAWYKSRGYVQFRDHRPLFPEPSPNDPERLLMAIFLRKTAEQIRGDQGAA